MAKRTYPTIGWNQKEAHTLRLKVSRDGSAYNVSGATITLWCKRKLDSGTTYLFEKEDADFTKDVGGNAHWCEVVIAADDLDFSGEAYIIVQYDNGAGNKPKSILRLVLEPSPE